MGRWLDTVVIVEMYIGTSVIQINCGLGQSGIQKSRKLVMLNMR